jgi:ABC-type branched-subunit amino acid transport system ATPase component
MIDVQHISRGFGKLVALKDVSFSVRPGEILGLVGPNGAGKTTPLEIVGGLLPAQSGSVVLGDAPEAEIKVRLAGTEVTGPSNAFVTKFGRMKA